MNSGSKIADCRSRIGSATDFINAQAYHIAELAWRITDRQMNAKRYPNSANFYTADIDGLRYAIDSARSALQWLSEADRRAVCAKAREFSATMRERHYKTIDFLNERRAA